MARGRFQPAEFERKWQEWWDKQGIYYASDDDSRENYYNLVMFPYPSGDLHIGHWYNYTGADIYGRYMRMRGYNVSQPIGFDAFGLPAENAAIKRNIQPREWTLDNIGKMQAQMRLMGAGWDWPREVVTCLPDYYRWTQWLFLQFYKQGLAYRTKASANWCPHCNTTLANEQVVNGHCERCGTLVERREIDQWLLRITKYADELLRFDGMDWPEKTRLMQTNWIGRSEGAEIRFRAELPKKRGKGTETVEIPVFTTRPDTIYGVTFFVLAPEHPLVERMTTPEQREAVRDYVERTRHETEIDRLSIDVARPEDRRPAGDDRHESGERRAGSGLDRRLCADGLWLRRGDGCSRARSARLRVRARLRPADHPGDPAGGRGGERSGDVGGGKTPRGRDRQQRRTGRRASGRGHCAVNQADRGEGRGQGGGDVPAARLADQPAALLGRADPYRLLRGAWRGARP